MLNAASGTFGLFFLFRRANLEWPVPETAPFAAALMNE